MRMSYVQMGFLSMVLDWVIDHIIKPVFEFLGNIISDIFRVIFNNVLEPIFEKLVSFAIKIIKVVTFNILYDILFQMQRAVLSILSAIERCFRVLVGLDPVYVEGQERDSLLYALFMDKNMMKILTGFMVVGFILCFGMSIIGVLRSIVQMEGEGRMRKPVGHVMRQTGSALLRLLLVPALGLVLILLASAIARSVDLATRKDSKTTMATTIFTIATLNAVRPTPEFFDGFDDAAFYNSTTRSAALLNATDKQKKDTADFGLTDKYRKDWYEGKRDYGSMTDILKTFDLQRIDFVISIGIGLMFIWLLGSACLMLVGRIFNLLILLLVEPFFAATIPWDDGEKFRKWSDTFTGMLFSGLGLLVGMNIYLSVIGLIFSNKVAFFGKGTTEGVIYLVDLLFVGVGGMAIKSVGPMVTSIMSAAAGRQESDLLRAGGEITGSAMELAGAPVISLGKTAGAYVGGKIGGKLLSLFSGSGSDNAEPGKGDAFGGGGKGSAAAQTAPGSSKFDGKKPQPSANNKPGIGTGTGSGAGGQGGFGGRRTDPIRTPLGLPMEDDHKYIVVGEEERRQKERHKAELDREKQRRESRSKDEIYEHLFGVPRPGSGDGADKDNKFDGSKSGTQLNEQQKREQQQKDEQKQNKDQKDPKNESMQDLIDGGQSGQKPGSGSTSMYDFFNVPRPENNSGSGAGSGGGASMQDMLGLGGGDQNMQDMLHLDNDPFSQQNNPQNDLNNPNNAFDGNNLQNNPQNNNLNSQNNPFDTGNPQNQDGGAGSGNQSMQEMLGLGGSNQNMQDMLHLDNDPFGSNDPFGGNDPFGSDDPFGSNDNALGGDNPFENDAFSINSVGPEDDDNNGNNS